MYNIVELGLTKLLRPFLYKLVCAISFSSVTLSTGINTSDRISGV